MTTALVAVATLALPAQAATTAGDGSLYFWPNGYTYPNATSTDLAWYVNVHSFSTAADDPVYTAYQFYFEHGDGGYVGLMNRANGQKQVIFNVWDGTAGAAQPAEGACRRFSNEGVGTHCEAFPVGVVNDRWYRLAVARTGRVAGGDVWSATFTDLVTGAVTPVGSISLRDQAGAATGYGNLRPVGAGFVEYVGVGPGNGNPCSNRSSYDFEYYGPTFNRGTNRPAWLAAGRELGLTCLGHTYSSAGAGYSRLAFDPRSSTANPPIANFMSTRPAATPSAQASTAPESITGDAPLGYRGKPYAFQYDVVNSPQGCYPGAAYGGAFPPGLTWDAWTCTLSGTPTQPGIFSFDVLTRDARRQTHDTIVIWP